MWNATVSIARPDALQKSFSCPGRLVRSVLAHTRIRPPFPVSLSERQANPPVDHVTESFSCTWQDPGPKGGFAAILSTCLSFATTLFMNRFTADLGPGPPLEFGSPVHKSNSLSLGSASTFSGALSVALTQ